MSLVETKFVSCGESVKIWDFSTFTLLHEFLPPVTSTGFSSVSWTLDGNSLASLPSSSSSIIFSKFQGQNVFNTEVKIGVKHSCSSYDNVNSRYLAIGTKGGEVLCWDTHLQKIDKTFCSKNSEITSLVFGSNNHLAFGTLYGEIYLYNHKSHVITGPLVKEHTENIRSLDFIKGKLVSASDDGGINLWDVNANKLIYGFENCHQAPAMCVKFLLPNLHSAVSVGLDKKMHIVDFRAKKKAHVFTCDQPLRAVDILRDATNLIVGGSKGDIQRYNLLTTSTVETFHAHNGPINYLALSKTENSKTENSAVTNSSASLVSNKKKNKSPCLKENEPIKPLSSHQLEGDKFLQRKTWSESSSSNNLSSSQPSFEFPLVINSKETLVPQSPDSNSNDTPMDVVNEKFENNPVEELLHYLVSNGVAQEKGADNVTKRTTPNLEAKCPNSLDDLQIVISHVTESIKEAKLEMHMNQMHLFTKIMKHFVDIKEEIRELQNKFESQQCMEEELHMLREENKRLKAAL